MSKNRTGIVFVFLALIALLCLTFFAYNKSMLPGKSKTRPLGNAVHSSRKNIREAVSDHDPLKIKHHTNNHSLNVMLSSNRFPKRGDADWDSFIQDFVHMASDNPSEALKVLNAAVENQTRDDILALNMFYAQGVAIIDPCGAIEWANSLTDKTLKISCLDSIFSVWTQSEKNDPVRLLDQLKQFASDDWAHSYFPKAIKLLASQDADSADIWISKNLENNPNLYYSSLAVLLSEIGKTSPTKLMSSLESYDMGDRKSGLISSVVNNMASTSIENAMEFVKLLSGKDYENAALAGLAGNSFEKAPDSILNLIKNAYPNGAAELISSGLSQWIYKDPTISIDWILDQSMDLKVDLARFGVPQAIAIKQPSVAVDFVDSLAISGADKTSQFQEIAAIWARSDPEKSILWIASLDQDMQSKVVLGYVNSLKGESVQMVESFLSQSNISDAARESAYVELNGDAK